MDIHHLARIMIYTNRISLAFSLWTYMLLGLAMKCQAISIYIYIHIGSLRDFLLWTCIGPTWSVSSRFVSSSYEGYRDPFSLGRIPSPSIALGLLVKWPIFRQSCRGPREWLLLTVRSWIVVRRHGQARKGFPGGLSLWWFLLWFGFGFCLSTSRRLLLSDGFPSRLTLSSDSDSEEPAVVSVNKGLPSRPFFLPSASILLR